MKKNIFKPLKTLLTSTFVVNAFLCLEPKPLPYLLTYLFNCERSC